MLGEGDVFLAEVIAMRFGLEHCINQKSLPVTLEKDRFINS